MWKIERAVEGDAVVFKVSGRMQGELLAELEKAFAAETKTPAVAVDMQNVRLADQETVRFLAFTAAKIITTNAAKRTTVAKTITGTNHFQFLLNQVGGGGSVENAGVGTDGRVVIC